MTPVTSMEELERLLESSDTAIVFKHSTRCPVSAMAFLEVKRFVSARPDVPVYLIKVVEDRPLSLHFAKRVGVPHESPQAILLRSGKAVWHDSHEGVTADALESALTAGSRLAAVEVVPTR